MISIVVSNKFTNVVLGLILCCLFGWMNNFCYIFSDEFALQVEILCLVVSIMKMWLNFYHSKFFIYFCFRSFSVLLFEPKLLNA